jgi:hypothetical protein
LQRNDKAQKVAIVAFTYAIVDERAMMVKHHDTIVTKLTMATLLLEGIVITFSGL